MFLIAFARTCTFGSGIHRLATQIGLGLCLGFGNAYTASAAGEERDAIEPLSERAENTQTSAPNAVPPDTAEAVASPLPETESERRADANEALAPVDSAGLAAENDAPTAMPPTPNLLQTPPSESESDTAVANMPRTGASAYQSLCASCHGEDGRGTYTGEWAIAPSLHDNPRVNGDLTILINILVKGLKGPIDGQYYAGEIMPAIIAKGDDYVAQVLNYIRDEFGGVKTGITAEQVAIARAASANRKTLWTQAELQRELGEKLSAKDEWRVDINFTTATEQPLIQLVDDDKATVFSSREPLNASQTILIALPRLARIAQVVIHRESAGKTQLPAYDIAFSRDRKQWRKVAESLNGGPLDHNQTLGLRAQYILISNRHTDEQQRWQINEIDVIGSYTE